MQHLIILNISLSDCIDIVDIIVTSLLGVWIALAVQSNLTKKRYLQEYFISEVKEIRDLYKTFINQLYNDNYSAIEIKEWFKVMSIRAQNLDKFLKLNYKIQGSLIVSKHAEIQQTITLMDDFNINYNSKVVSFSSNSKKEILELHSELSCNIIQRIIDINNAKQK
ncbi:MAG TPA: hypothetical protein DEO70_12105 [Bacteroidales bacterium]|nr:MAG: hypothetical protein A2X11_10095 [Bacteroidetes bacterium GWE2_42_24]OFY25863.1 MAG: hypothetical protein A2X09_09470 [Bacteroidetes bacterium GWF2_43_11]HBZ67571.1 hypothetical protein [Bacteroidales bacterium]